MCHGNARKPPYDNRLCSSYQHVGGYYCPELTLLQEMCPTDENIHLNNFN